MSMIHEALKKAAQDKAETYPTVPVANYAPQEISVHPKVPSLATIGAVVLLIVACVVSAFLYNAMRTERDHRLKAEMTLVQKEQKINDLQSKITVLTEENQQLEDQSLKDRQEYAAVTAELKKEFADLSEEQSALAAELEAKKKALGRLAYQVHQYEKTS